LKELRKLIQILLNILIPLMTIGLVIWLLPKGLRYFLPFVIGGIIAWLANPIVRWMERKIKLHRKYSTVLTIAGALALVIGGGYLVISRLWHLGKAFLLDLPQLLEGAADRIGQVFANVTAATDALPPALQIPNLAETLSGVGNAVMGMVNGMASGLGESTMSAAGNVAKSIPAVFVSTFMVILSAYFFLAEKERLAMLYRKHAPRRLQEYLGLIRNNTGRVIGGYFLAQFKIMMVVAAMLIAGFLILRIPYAAVWAILISLLDVLPVFGTGTVLIPWTLIEILSGQYYMAIGLAACWLLTQSVRQMIQPKMVGDSMDLDPLMTLLFLFLGFKVSGLGGMILAVPVGLILIEFYKFGAFDPLIQALRELRTFINEFRKGTPEREDKIHERSAEESAGGLNNGDDQDKAPE